MISHEFLLIMIMIGVGIIAGITNFLFYYFKNNTKPYEIFKYLLSGIGAALLVPLVLNMLSSDLIRKTDNNYNTLNYFVFAGFCFIAGYFSDRFISTVGEKILKDIESTNAKVDTAIKATKKIDEKVNILASVATEDEEGLNNALENFSPREIFKDEDMNEQLKKIIKALSNPKFKFRTHTGIAKELNYPPLIVKSILESLEGYGIVKRFDNSDGKEIWAVTKLAQLFEKKE